MSSVIELPETISIDPTLDISSRKTVVIRRGASSSTQQRTSATSTSNSQVIFNVQLNNSKSSIISAYNYVEMPITVTITAAGLTGPNTIPVYLQDNFSLRQYPLSSITSVAQVQINNQSSSSNPAQFIHQLSQFQDFINGDDEQALQSITPIMPDQSPVYADAVGSHKSPLNGYYAGGEHYSGPRGQFNSLFNTSVGTTATWVFTTTIREPIFNPLLSYSPGRDTEGFPYVNLFNVQLTFISNISRMFSLDLVTCPAITGISVNIDSATLVQRWLTVPVNMIMPKVALKSFNTLVCNQTALTSFSAGEQRTVQSQSYSMNQIPKKVFVFVANAQTDTATGYSLADFSFSIQQLTVLFNNKSGLMSNLNTADLYNTCMAEEGNKMDFVQSQAFTGAVLCLDFAKLMGLSESECPGVLGNFNLQIQAQVTNISSSAVVPNIWLIYAMDTILSTDENSISNLTQGFLTAQDILQAAKLPAHAENFRQIDIYGGSKFTDFFKRIGSNINSFLKSTGLVSKGLAAVGTVFPEALPVTLPASQIAKNLGYGKVSQRTLKSYRY